MITDIERRDFLRQAVMAGLVIGFPWGRARGDEPAGAADAIALARAEMARRGAPGVLIVLSRLDVSGPTPKGPDIDQLNRLFGGSTPPRDIGFREAHQPNAALLGLFARAVFACATVAEVERALGAEAARSAVLRLDPGGGVGAAVARDPALDRDDAFVASVVALLDGTEGKALESAAAHQRAAFSALAAQADLAIGQLDAADYVTREAASVALLDVADRLGNALVLAARRTTSIEARTRLAAVTRAYVERHGARAALEPSVDAPNGDARLVVPLGLRWGHLNDHFHCPPCGMGAASTEVRRYVTLVAGNGK